MKDINKNYYGMFTRITLNPAVYIMAKNAGLDFIFYDAEHAMLQMDKLHDLVLFGNNMGLSSFIRVAELSRKDVSAALDCGATGIMVPMIETAEEAYNLVQWSKYPPIGDRGYSGGANTNYSPLSTVRENLDAINDKTVTIAQIETKKGIENAEEIIKTEGIDAVIIGPVDLSISLGVENDILDKVQVEAIDKVVALCKKYQKTFGIIGENRILEHYKNDVNYLVSAFDTNIIRDGLIKAVKDYDDILNK